MLKDWLAHPLTRGLDIDDPRTTELRRRIIREKVFLRKIYQEWYHSIASALPDGEGAVLELGSGAGFLSEIVPRLITSEIFVCSDVKAVVDGIALPFRENSLRGIVMTDVFHHLSEPRRFFMEAARCVCSGGVIVMIEPWVSAWSRFVYTRFHHEPFRPDAETWGFPQSGPISGANGALPWIVFQRDRDQFVREFPDWQIVLIRPTMPFRYLISGGVSMRDLMPGWSFGAWRGLERILGDWIDKLAMFAEIILSRA